ncbi:MAG: arylsulfatase [Bryobacterales bacterium]|jgi:arylsulfatase A-like enzyme|nr:arylsulfatase [Bryobacterales bacterium]
MLTRRRFLENSAALLAAPAVPVRQPNFVFILIDDLGWRDVGFNGSSFYETPNIDALAARGMKFTNAYAAAPVCSATRASIITGKYPARLAITNSPSGKHRLAYSKMLPPESQQYLPLEETTLAEELRAAGYTSAAIGKWHLGGPRYYPEKQGFDVNVGGTYAGSPRSQFFPQWNGEPPIHAAQGAYLADTLTDAAEDFIGKNSKRAFFLYLAHYGVHIPLEGKPGIVGRYERKTDARHSDPQHNAGYAAMVQSIDESVGRLVRRVEGEGLSEHTVFVFTSDNGGLVSAEYKGQAATSNAPLKAGKGFLNEGGIWVPMCIVCPGVTKSGSVCEAPVISTDIYPTVARMAGVRRFIGAPRDGVDLLPALRGGVAPKRDALFWHYPHYSDQGGRPGAAIRMGEWKLIRWYEDDRVELYNLAGDTGELKNLAAAEPARATELQAALEAWLQSTNSIMPVPNPDYDAARETEGLPEAVREQLRKGELPTPAPTH